MTVLSLRTLLLRLVGQLSVQKTPSAQTTFYRYNSNVYNPATGISGTDNMRNIENKEIPSQFQNYKVLSPTELTLLVICGIRSRIFDYVR
jgi:hypothetical protein